MSSLICGIDEVGRGSWAGPICVGIVVASPNLRVAGLRDSKKMTPKKRAEIISAITRSCEYVGVGAASPDEIDQFGITKALQIAADRAFWGVTLPEEIILDGQQNYLSDQICDNTKVRCVKKADDYYQVVSAASVIAKEYRDTMMASFGKGEQGELKPYLFDKHFGYVTKAHKEVVANIGLSSIHRRLWNVTGG